MANELLAEGFLQLRVAAALEAYANALSLSAPCKDLADRVRKNILESFLRVESILGVREPAIEQLRSEEMAHAWIARALTVWPLLTAEAEQQRHQSEHRQRWQSLHEQCGEIRQEVDGVLKQGRSRLRMFVSAGTITGVLDEASVVLSRCHEAFEELAAGAGSVSTTLDHVPGSPWGSLKIAVEDLLQQTPNDWLPKKLAELHRDLVRRDSDRYAGLLARMAPSPVTPSLWAEWGRYLEKSWPEIAPMARSRLIVLRAVVEAVNDSSPGIDEWDLLENLVGPVLTSAGLEARLIRDFVQHPDEFTIITDTSQETPRLGRVGLALRTPGVAWLCFPPAVQRQPLPVKPAPTIKAVPQSPQERALAEADFLVEQAQNACLALGHGAGPADETALNLRSLKQDQPQSLEAKWTQMKQTWEAENLVFLPERWTFLQAVLWETLELDEKNLSVVFHANVVRGEVFWIKAFGLQRRDADLIRACEVCVSAGASPCGFEELCHIVVKAANPGEEHLKQRLNGWPRACLHDAFRVAAECLFIDFWSPLGDEMRLQNPEAAHRFAAQLSQVLANNLRLQTFYPETYQDYPAGWLVLESDRGGVTGKVRRIIRPGLKDEQENLHVPAIVEID
jgi:hypothetical protein